MTNGVDPPGFGEPPGSRRRAAGATRWRRIAIAVGGARGGPRDRDRRVAGLRRLTTTTASKPRPRARRRRATSTTRRRPHWRRPPRPRRPTTAPTATTTAPTTSSAPVITSFTASTTSISCPATDVSTTLPIAYGHAHVGDAERHRGRPQRRRTRPLRLVRPVGQPDAQRHVQRQHAHLSADGEGRAGPDRDEDRLGRDAQVVSRRPRSGGAPWIQTSVECRMRTSSRRS